MILMLSSTDKATRLVLGLVKETGIVSYGWASMWSFPSIKIHVIRVQDQIPTEASSRAFAYDSSVYDWVV